MSITLELSPDIEAILREWARERGFDEDNMAQQALREWAASHQKKTPAKRRAGSLAGQIWMSPDFDAPLEDFKAYSE